MAHQVTYKDYFTRCTFGFIAGFLATLVFQQLTWWVLWHAGLAPFNAFSFAANSFGVPEVISHAVWGGIWGILFAMFCPKFPAGNGYWAAAFLFGAILPSAVGLLVVMPLKGNPVGGGWHLPRLLTAFLSNGAWGIGAGLILRMQTGSLSWSRGRQP